jgi:diaminopimelate decarboxylase
MELVNNKFCIQNIDLESVVDKYGAPIYIYDFDRMTAQYQRLTSAFSKLDLKIQYACKALNNINVLKHFRSLGSGIDAVSIQEVWLAKQAGFQGHEIIYTPNCVSMDEINMAVEEGCLINIDNISILEQFANKYQRSIPVCIRFNPHITAGGNHKISTGHIDSKFGISIHQLRHVERIVKSSKLKVNGLHMHTGSDILDVEVFLRGADILLDIAEQFSEIEFIDFGSGFKVPYKPGDESTNIEELGEKLTLRIVDFEKKIKKKVKILFEPGKFLVSESGCFIVKTNVVKQTTATVFAGVDTGLNHLIRPMFYDGYHHIVNISNPEGTPRYYTVVGYICETDTFAWDRKINEIREGDLLCFMNAGAYGYTMSSNYNARFRPAEVMVHKGNFHLIRSRETMEDLLKNQIVIS